MKNSADSIENEDGEISQRGEQKDKQTRTMSGKTGTLEIVQEIHQPNSRVFNKKKQKTEGKKLLNNSRKQPRLKVIIFEILKANPRGQHNK